MDPKRIKIDNMDPAERRLALLNYRPITAGIPPEIATAMERVDGYIEDAGRLIASAVLIVPHDTGRLIAAIDSLNTARHAAHDALLLSCIPVPTK
jgi:hypothetical protein